MTDDSLAERTDRAAASAHPNHDADPFTGPAWEGAGRLVTASDPSSPVRVKVSRRRKRLLRRRRRIGWVLIGLGGLVVLAAAWLVVTGLMARSQLDAMRGEVHTLRAQIAAGDLRAAARTATTVGKHADQAHSLTTGPVWALAAALPGGGPLHSVRVITASADRLGHEALPQLVQAARSLEPATLRRPDGSIDLTPLAAAAPGLHRADTVVRTAVSAIAALPAHTWLPALDAARADVLTQLQGLAHTVHAADLTARLVPPLLGVDGEHTYLMVFQNEAEARGTGGLPGAFALVTTDRGKIRFARFGSDAALNGVAATVSLGAAYNAEYAGAATTTQFGNANLSPNFPYAAQIWASMWKNHTGQPVDGVIAVDPTVLSYLLDATGPATLADGTVVSGSDVVELTQSTLYAKYPKLAQTAQRREYLLRIAEAASKKIVSQRGDASALVKALGKAASERRLLVWSANPSLQRLLGPSAVGGQIPETSTPYAGLSIVNDGGNKLDYYLHRSLSWTSSGCGATRSVTATIKLTNDAPAAGLSPYVTHRSDRHSYPVRPGDNRLEVGYFATAGGQLTSVTVNGHAATTRSNTARGHPVYTIDLELPRGTTRTIELHLNEPRTPGPVQMLRQPLIHPLQVSVTEPSC